MSLYPIPIQCTPPYYSAPHPLIPSQPDLHTFPMLHPDTPRHGRTQAALIDRDPTNPCPSHRPTHQHKAGASLGVLMTQHKNTTYHTPHTTHYTAHTTHYTLHTTYYTRQGTIVVLHGCEIHVVAKDLEVALKAYAADTVGGEHIMMNREQETLAGRHGEHMIQAKQPHTPQPTRTQSHCQPPTNTPTLIGNSNPTLTTQPDIHPSTPSTPRNPSHTRHYLPLIPCYSPPATHELLIVLTARVIRGEPPLTVASGAHIWATNWFLYKKKGSEALVFPHLAHSGYLIVI